MNAKIAPFSRKRENAKTRKPDPDDAKNALCTVWRDRVLGTVKKRERMKGKEQKKKRFLAGTRERGIKNQRKKEPRFVRGRSRDSVLWGTLPRVMTRRHGWTGARHTLGCPVGCSSFARLIRQSEPRGRDGRRERRRRSNDRALLKTPRARTGPTPGRR